METVLVPAGIRGGHMISESNDFFLGVDIGGTKVAAGLVNTDGELVYKARKPMRTTAGAQEALDCVRSAIDTVLEANPSMKLRGIGLSAPGSINHEDGVVITATNLPCWHHFAL